MENERYLLIRVELVTHSDREYDTTPGRDFLVHPSDTFASLANAIDRAFARWDLSHAHLFRLAGERTVGPADPDWEVEDEDGIKVGDTLKLNDQFDYVFDLGDEWTHDCRVLRDDVDVEEEFGGPLPESPISVFGWGSIPDQYGRSTPEG